MAFNTKLPFSDRQQVQFSGDSITLSGNTIIDQKGNFTINPLILNSDTGGTYVNIGGLTGYTYLNKVSNFVFKPTYQVDSSGNTINNIDVTNYVLTSYDSGGTVIWKSLSADTDNFITNGDYTGGTLTLNRQNGSLIITGFSTGEIYVKNTVYVSKNGNDSTGLVERFDKPFLTINQAINSVNIILTGRTVYERVKIVVESGMYVENIILDKFIDFDLSNCIIEGYITDDNNDFGVIDSGLWHNIIYGNSTLKKTQVSGSYGQSVILLNSNNNVLINCSLITSSINDAIAMVGGYCKVYCDNIIGDSIISNTHNAINMAADPLSTRCILEVYNSNIDTYSGGSSSSIDFSTSGQTLSLVNCSVRTTISDVTTSAGITCGRSSTSVNSILKLYNTTLYSEDNVNGASIWVNNDCSLDVYYIGTIVGNKNNVLVGSGIINSFIGVLTVDSNLLY